MALARAEAALAVAACREAGVVLGGGNNKRYFASMHEMKRVVASGEIGEVMRVEGHYSNEHSTRVAGGWRDDPRESPGAGMTGAGMHILDAFVNFAGPARYVDARTASKKASPDPRDAVAALIEFESGATDVMATVRAAPMYWRVHVFGTNGSAEARGEDTLIVTKIGGTPKEATYPHVDSLRVLIEAFADAVEGRAPFPVTTDDMLNVIGLYVGVCVRDLAAFLSEHAAGKAINRFLVRRRHFLAPACAHEVADRPHDPTMDIVQFLFSQGRQRSGRLLK